MGSMLTKNSPGLVVWRNRRVERERKCETHRQLPSGTSSDTTQGTVNAHHVEICVCQVTQENENEAHMMGPSDVTEPLRLQKTSPEGVETPLLVGTSRSAEAASNILAAETAVKVADSNREIVVRTEAHPAGLDLQCEDDATAKGCKMHVVGQAFGGSSEKSNEDPPTEYPLHSSMVSEEDILLEAPPTVSPVVQKDTSRKATEGLQSPLNIPDEVEPAADDQNTSCERDVELDPKKAVGNAEDGSVVPRQVNDASSRDTVEMAEAHPSFASAATSNSAVIEAVQETKQVTEAPPVAKTESHL